LSLDSDAFRDTEENRVVLVYPGALEQGNEKDFTRKADRYLESLTGEHEREQKKDETRGRERSHF